MRYILTTISICCAVNCLGQLILNKPYYARVIVPEDIYATVDAREIVIDTLIMDNNSSLRFASSRVSMRVNRADIGKKVKWKGAGTPGTGKGGYGTNGTTLMMDVVFYKLAQLMIDSRGGTGSSGEAGRGWPGTPGANGQDGGNGGNGGDLHLRYRCIGFTPNFGSKGKNSITFKQKGGSGGIGGMGGSTRSPTDIRGRPGLQGEKGSDGKLTLEDMDITPLNKKAVLEPFSSASHNKYEIVAEMLSTIAGVLNRPNRTTNIYQALEDLDRSMRLGLRFQIKKYESLSFALPGRESFHLIEAETTIQELTNLCEYLKPAITYKLDSVDLKYEYSEYITDFFLTTIDNGSSLVPKGYRKNPTAGFQYARDPGRGFTVMRVSETSQTFKSGLRAGDRIVNLSGVPSSFLGGGAFSKLVELDTGQRIALSFERNGQVFDLTLICSEPRQPPIKAKMERLPGDILYLSPGELVSGKASSIRTFIEREGKFNAIILDLRNCPGGYLREATDLAGIFLDKSDTIARVSFTSNSTPETYLGTVENPVRPRTMLILTNGNTASGAEVIVAALRHNKVAQTVGTATYGFGEIMQHYAIGRGHYILRINSGELYGPGGRLISSSQIQPDFVVSEDEDVMNFALTQISKP